MPNISPAAFGVPAAPTRSRYGRAIVNMRADLQDCWPCDDASGVALRNIVNAGTTLSMLTGQSFRMPSMLGSDPKGYAIRMTGNLATAGAYTLPASGTLEGLYAVPGPNDSMMLGNWNGNGVMIYSVTGLGASGFRIYMNGTNVSYTSVAADWAKSPVHLATTWDGTTQRLYINGIQRLSQAVGSPSAAGKFGIGQYSNAGTGAVYCGLIQWLAVYTRALGPTEIASHAALVTQPA